MSLQRMATLILVACSITLLPGHGQAQQAIRIGLGAVGGYYTIEGDDFEEADPGFGAEGILRLTLLERLQLGGGVHWSRHRVDVLNTDLDVLVAFAEGRLTFARESPNIAPFIAGRVGYALSSTEIRVQGLEVEADAAGYLLGAIAGLEFPLGEHLALEGSASYYWLSFGETELSGSPITLPESRGHALGIRAGLNLYF